MRVFLTVVLFLMILFGCFEHSANAADFKVVPGGSGEPSLVLVTGELFYGDQKRFVSQTLNLDSALVVLNSPGGNVMAGIEIGKAIRLKDFHTYVPEDTLCASACALAWLGGTKRLMSRTAQIGFHAAYRVENGETSESGMANAIVGGYLNSLGLSQKAIAFVTAARPDAMRWLTQEGASEVGIEVAVFDLPKNEKDAETPSTTGQAEPPATENSACSLTVNVGSDDAAFLNGCTFHHPRSGVTIAFPRGWQVTQLEHTAWKAYDPRSTTTRSLLVDELQNRSLEEFESGHLEKFFSFDSPRLDTFYRIQTNGLDSIIVVMKHRGWRVIAALLGHCESVWRIIYKRSSADLDEDKHFYDSLQTLRFAKSADCE